MKFDWPLQRAIIAPTHESLLDGPAIARAYRKARGRDGGLPLLFGVDAHYVRHPTWLALMRMTGAWWNAEVVALGPDAPFGLRRMLRHLEREGVVVIFPSGGISEAQERPGLDFLRRRSGALVYRLKLRQAIGRGRYAWPAIIPPGCMEEPVGPESAA